MNNEDTDVILKEEYSELNIFVHIAQIYSLLSYDNAHQQKNSIRYVVLTEIVPKVPLPNNQFEFREIRGDRR